MTDLSPILPKLSRLVPRLASDADGEIVATVRAINRTLRGAGLDWHDFTSALAPALPPPQRHARPDPQSHRPRTHYEIAEWCRQRASAVAGVLGSKKTQFVCDMTRLLRTRQPTERQRAWLLAIYQRLGGPQ